MVASESLTEFCSTGLRRVGPLFAQLRYRRRGAGDPEEDCVDIRTSQEEPYIASCMRLSGVRLVETVDSLGRQRFLPFQLADHLFRMPYNADPDDWWWAGKDRKNELQNAIAAYPVVTHNYDRAEVLHAYRAVAELHKRQAAASADYHVISLEEMMKVLHPEAVQKS
uniref:Uncharacterized protein n=1 Tax=Pinguiococcus pyrenoidosus TaxID=172671 RepID=A0A7R9U287_9STRA|eukprot:scaffold79_cov259-Pinguiococcus_pyrenoidosus.AAC.1